MTERGRRIGEEFAESEAQVVALNEALAARELVCPLCGSGERIGTMEAATIWQPATFTLLEEGATDYCFEREDERRVECEWDAYDSDDVGDTETVGWFCAACSHSWSSEFSSFPFVTPAEFAAKGEPC